MTREEEISKIIWKAGLCKLRYCKDIKSIKPVNLTQEECNKVAKQLIAITQPEIDEDKIKEILKIEYEKYMHPNYMLIDTTLIENQAKTIATSDVFKEGK